MPSLRLTGRRGLHTAAVTAFTVAALALLLTALIGPEPPPAVALRAPATSAPPGRPQDPATALPHSPPTRIDIAELKTKTHVEQVGLAADGTIAMPSDPDHAGWYTGSVAPGENGNTILVGHLDSSSGPAAFYGLGALRPGDRITVRRRDCRPPTSPSPPWPSTPRTPFRPSASTPPPQARSSPSSPGPGRRPSDLPVQPRHHRPSLNPLLQAGSPVAPSAGTRPRSPPIVA